ncbi:MAG TPA: hypothetical protein VML96_13640 [Egibacteraceae bacterium]|nr:hypothetical protein [Egibacteraceae bacterium]
MAEEADAAGTAPTPEREERQPRNGEDAPAGRPDAAAPAPGAPVDAPGAGSEAAAERAARRDATTVRRALTAGALSWALITGALSVVGVAGGGGLRAIGSAAVIALVLGSSIASAWLLLAAGLDLVAGEQLSRRRGAWTIGVVLFALLSPLLMLALPD